MKISCEIPSETMNICIHGVPVKYECGRCADSHRLNILESQIKILIEKIDNHKKSVFDEAFIKDLLSLVERVDRCERTHGLLEDMIEHAEKGIEKCFDYMDRKPHKCPVCEGRGSKHEEVEPKVLKITVCISCEGKGIIWG